jgi:superoxide dismutase
LLSPAALKIIYEDHQTGLVNRLNELIAGQSFKRISANSGTIVPGSGISALQEIGIAGIGGTR